MLSMNIYIIFLGQLADGNQKHETVKSFHKMHVTIAKTCSYSLFQICSVMADITSQNSGKKAGVKPGVHESQLSFEWSVTLVYSIAVERLQQKLT